MKSLTTVFLLIAAPIILSGAVCPVLSGQYSSETVLYSTWTSPGYCCSFGDKTFSNFNQSGVPAGTSMQIFIMPGPQHTVEFLLPGQFGTPFTVGYDVAVNAGSNLVITAAGMDLQSVLSNTPTNVETIKSGASTIATLTATIMNAATPQTFTGQTSITVLNRFNSNGGFADTIANAFLQSLTPQSVACPRTQGYWKTHANAWPMATLTIGGISLSKSECIDVLKTAPAGNAVLILEHQLIAAMLNVAGGSNPAAQILINLANSVLTNHVYGGVLTNSVAPSSTLGQQMVNLSDQLDSYNNNGTGCVGPT